MNDKILTLFFVLSFAAFSMSAFSQQTASGIVKDADGEPVVGASVLLVGKNTVYAMTDLSGAYTISVPADGQLKVSCMGYKEKTVSVNGHKTLNIVLDSDSTLLDETIVVAFGTTTKEAFTGSATVVKSEDLQKRQTTNIQNALVGSVPGLQLKGASGAPGSSAGSINIRGIASMYAGTDPLIVVDGAPYTASLSNIPQNDIESITVLKDAASAALYGARGAAGVILVTTKRSKSRDAIVNFDSRWGVNTRSLQEYTTLTDPGEDYQAAYAMLFNNNYYNNGLSLEAANKKANDDMLKYLGYQAYTIPEGQQLVGIDGKLNPSATLGYAIKDGDETFWIQPDNWKDMAYKSALRQDYNLSVNGGTDRSNFYASVGYLNEDGIIEYSGYERITTRFKADYQVKKWLNIGGNISYTHSRTDSNPNMSTSGSSTNLMYYTSMIAPIYPVYVRVLKDGNPVIRTDEVDQVYRTIDAKFNAVADDIAVRHAAGQPCLVGTVSIESSERLSRLLDKRGIPHETLNAKNHEREAHIIAQAGRVDPVHHIPEPAVADHSGGEEQQANRQKPGCDPKANPLTHGVSLPVCFPGRASGKGSRGCRPGPGSGSRQS